MVLPKKFNIIVKINNKSMMFRSSYKIAEFFNDDNNIRDINGLSDEIKFILTRPHLINRVLKLLNNEEQEFFTKEKTRDKYKNIPNFKLERVIIENI